MTFQLDQKVGRPDILVNDLGRMHVRQDMCQSAGDVQAGRKIHAQATIKNGFERLACEVVQDHRQAPVFINQGCRFCNPHDIKGLEQQVFASETSKMPGTDIVRIELLQNDRRIVFQTSRAIKMRTCCRADVVKYLITCNHSCVCQC